LAILDVNKGNRGEFIGHLILPIHPELKKAQADPENTEMPKVYASFDFSPCGKYLSLYEECIGEKINQSSLFVFEWLKNQSP
jgi:hypothetical protein